MKKIITILIGLVFILNSCAPGKSESPIEIQTDRYRVIDFDPPKHASVDLIRLSDGRTFRISLGKRCSGWRELGYIGREVELNRYVYTDGESDQIVFDGAEVKDCFCN